MNYPKLLLAFLYVLYTIPMIFPEIPPKCRVGSGNAGCYFYPAPSLYTNYPAFSPAAVIYLFQRIFPAVCTSSPVCFSVVDMVKITVFSLPCQFSQRALHLHPLPLQAPEGSSCIRGKILHPNATLCADSIRHAAPNLQDHQNRKHRYAAFIKLAAPPL